MVNIEGLTRFHTEMGTLRFARREPRRRQKLYFFLFLKFSLSLKFLAKAWRTCPRCTFAFFSFSLGSDVKHRMLNILGTSRMLNISALASRKYTLGLRGLG